MISQKQNVYYEKNKFSFSPVFAFGMGQVPYQRGSDLDTTI
jgi:hypothetical protein